MYPIIPNGTSNGSYPQHAAVQTTKDILNENPDNMGLLTQRIDEILQILRMLKDYDDAVARHTLEGKTVMTPSGSPHTPLMNKKNKLLNKKEYTAYEEYSNIFYDERGRPPIKLPSIREMLIPKFQGHGKLSHVQFDAVLAPTGPVSLAAPSAGASVLSMGAQANPVAAAAVWEQRFDPLPPGWEAITDPATGRIYYANPSLKITQWDRPSHQTPQQNNADYAQSHLQDGYYYITDVPLWRHAYEGFFNGFMDAMGKKYYFKDTIAKQLVDNVKNAKDGRYYFGNDTNPNIFFRYLDHDGNPAMIFDGNIYKLFQEPATSH